MSLYSILGRILILSLALKLLSACSTVTADVASEDEALREDRPVAEALALKLGASALSCQKLNTKVISEKDADKKTIWGKVWGSYVIEVQGCNKSISYSINCRDSSGEPNCYVLNK